MKKILIANWKMNPSGENEAVKLARQSDKKGVVIVPPMPFLATIHRVLKRAELGAQDVFWAGAGAYTGGVSAAMLKKVGVRYVIIGHSERRRFFNDTDEIINKKIKAAFAEGLKVILCVGEGLSVRKKGIAATKKFIEGQLTKDLEKTISHALPVGRLNKLKSKSLIVAYEPIWAIGTGKNDRPEDAVKIIEFIRKILHSKFYIPNSIVLYGGSVDFGNIKGFLSRKSIDGFLVGGASLRAGDFRKIIKISRDF